MEVSGKRKRNTDCPRITYDTPTKVFDRLFKEESLEEMKDLVRKKLGLSSSLPMHLSQLRDGKSVVLEDDDDFDAFYASVYSTPVSKIKVYFDDDQPPPASIVESSSAKREEKRKSKEKKTDGEKSKRKKPTAGAESTDVSLKSSTAHYTAADGPSHSKKRRVSFLETVLEPPGDGVEEPKKIQQQRASDESSRPSPNFEAPLIINVIPADPEEGHETGNAKKTREAKEQGKASNPTLEDQPMGKLAQSDIVVEASGSKSKDSTKKDHVRVSESPPDDTTKSKKRPRTSATDGIVQAATGVLDGTTTTETDDTEVHPRSSKKPKHRDKDSEDLEIPTANSTDDNQVDTRTKGLEESELHTPSNLSAEADILTAPPKEIGKSRRKKEAVEAVTTVKESNPLSASKSTKSNSATVVQGAEKQDSRPPASASGPETSNLKGEVKNPGSSRDLNTPAKKPTLNKTRVEETRSLNSAEGKPSTMKKSRKNKALVEGEANNAKDPALSSDVVVATRAAVDAILARKSLPGKSDEALSRSSPLVDVTTSSSAIHIVPVTTSPSPDDQPNNTSAAAEQPKTTPKCPICDRTPSHVRSRCPIIKSGIRSMRQRIAELQKDKNSDEERQKVIEELQRIIGKRTRPKAPTAENKSTNVKGTADKPISRTLVIDSPPVTQPPKVSNAVNPAEVPSQGIQYIPSPQLEESLACGDISSYTAQDLETLIRGPNVTLADMPSSDSSEDEESLEEEPEDAEDKLSRSQGRIRYPSSSDEEEEEASPFVPSIIPLPIRSTSVLSNEDESSRSEDFQGDITSFQEVNGLGSSLKVDETGDAAVNETYTPDFAHLSIPELSQNGREVGIGSHILSTPVGSQVVGESQSKTVSDMANPPVIIATPQSDPIEASEIPESPSSPIISVEDILQSTPKTEVAVRRSLRNNPTLLQKTTDLTPKAHSTSQICVNGVNDTNNKSKSVKKTGSLKRITDLPIPINPAIRVIKPAGVQTRRQTARAEEEADEPSQAKQKNGKLSSSKTSLKTTKTPAKIVKTPAKPPAKITIPSNGENTEPESVTMVQDTLEIMASPPNNTEQPLASWAILRELSQTENETQGMVDELHSSPDTHDFSLSSAREPVSPAVVNGVSKATDPLFLFSDSQQSFPYSQYPGFTEEMPGSEDEEDEVQASVIKPQMATKSSSKFRSLTEIASQPALFTPTLHLAQTVGDKEVTNLYGRASQGSEEESEDSDTESESETEAKAQTSHIPVSRRAGTDSYKR